MKFKKYLERVFRFIVKGVPNKIVYANISYTNPHEALKGKRIVVTGGGHGLGAAMAEKFLVEGAEVLIAGRNKKRLEETASRLGCSFLELDVSKPEVFDEFLDNAEKALGGLDLLVNNAGISLHENSFFDVTPETFDCQVNTNLKGGFFLTQSFIKKLKATDKKGAVLFVSSETGDTMDFRPYGFTKVAVNSMVQGLAYLFAKDGIRVNAVAPGITASDMTGLSSEGNIYYPVNTCERVYMPEEVAETACFLLSDAAGAISGQIITCNNARTINARWK